VKKKILEYLSQNPDENPGIAIPTQSQMKAMQPINKPKKKKKHNIKSHSRS